MVERLVDLVARRVGLEMAAAPGHPGDRRLEVRVQAEADGGVDRRSQTGCLVMVGARRRQAEDVGRELHRRVALRAAAGDPDINKKLLKGHKAGRKTFKVYLDGLNMLPHLAGEAKDSPRRFFAYVNDDGALVALRVDDWKIVFEEQRAKQMACWGEPFVHLRMPKLFHLRRDPFERADENSNSYWDWFIDRLFFLQVGAGIVMQQIQSFKEFPPRQKPASFNLDGVMESLKEASGAGQH